jgi:hypothetical protein
VRQRLRGADRGGDRDRVDPGALPDRVERLHGPEGEGKGVTADGCEVITKFPAEDLLVAGQRYYTVAGPLAAERDSQSHLNTEAGRGRPLP